jgi:regulator of replication initiation timing
MPYRQVLNSTRAFTASEVHLLIQENDALRAELDNFRTRFGQLLAKLDADAGVADTNYAALLTLAPARFTAT